MDWKTILKIKSPDGGYLKLDDWDRFKRILRAFIRPLALQFYGEAGRRTYINFYEKEEGDYTILELAFREPKTEGRMRFKFTFMEEDGDFVFVSAVGPHLKLGTNDVINDEFEIAFLIGKAIKQGIMLDMLLEPRGIPPKTEGKTDAEYIKEIEEANPGHKWNQQKGRLERKSRPEIEQELEGMTLGDYFRMYNVRF